MFPGSLGGSWSEPSILTEEEIFSRPIVNPSWGCDVFGNGANDEPLALLWGDYEEMDFENFTNLDSSLAMNNHSNSGSPHMQQPGFESQQVVAPVDPVYVPHGVQTRSNNGGLEDVLQESHRRKRQRQAAAPLASNETPDLLWLRQAYNNSSPALRRRPPGSSPTWYIMEGRRSATGKVSKPSPAHQENPKTPVYPQRFQSVLKHPFHVPRLSSIMARRGMYFLEENNAGTLPPPSSAPEVLCTLPTTTRINPAQGQVFTMAPQHPQYGPLMSSDSDLSLMPVVRLPPIRTPLDPLKAPDEVSTSLMATTLNPVQPEQAVSLMTDLPFEALMDADFECQPVTSQELDFENQSPSSDWSMLGSMEDVALWDHSSIPSSLFPEQALEPVQGPYRVHEASVVTDRVAYLANPMTDQAAAANVSSALLSAGPPEQENKHRRVPRPLKGMVAEAKSPRLKWVPELHDKFVAAVTSLGGPDVATPKAVLRVMDCGAEVHVFHVKSHLQKYRLQHLYSPKGTKQHHPSEQITLDVGESSNVQNEIEARLQQSIEVDMETSQNVAKMNKQLERTIASQETQMEQLEQMKRILEHQQAIRASSIDHPTSSSEAGALEFKVQVPKLVIVATECAVTCSSDDEQ